MTMYLQAQIRIRNNMAVAGLYQSRQIREGEDPRMQPAIDILLGNNDEIHDPFHNIDKLALDVALCWGEKDNVDLDVTNSGVEDEGNNGTFSIPGLNRGFILLTLISESEERKGTSRSQGRYETEVPIYELWCLARGSDRAGYGHRDRCGFGQEQVDQHGQVLCKRRLHQHHRIIGSTTRPFLSCQTTRNRRCLIPPG